MRPTRWMLRPVLLILAFAIMPATQASEGRQTQWKLANFTWVNLVPAEPGAPANAHPAKLTVEILVAALGPVQVTVEGREIPLFAKDELTGLAKALGEALSLAQPGEDLILLSSHRRGGLFLEQPQGLTARLFVCEGALNLMVQNARLDFMDRYAGDRTLPTFVYGSRKTASGTTLRSSQATLIRGDWLSIPLVTAPAKPTPEPPALPPAGSRDGAFFEAQTQRLKALKRLREENLLSETEYQEKREAILKTL